MVEVMWRNVGAWEAVVGRGARAHAHCVNVSQAAKRTGDGSAGTPLYAWLGGAFPDACVFLSGAVRKIGFPRKTQCHRRRTATVRLTKHVILTLRKLVHGCCTSLRPKSVYVAWEQRLRLFWFCR